MTQADEMRVGADTNCKAYICVSGAALNLIALGIGCNVGQGYLFAKPMAKRDLIGIMRRRLMPGPGGVAQPAARRAV